MEIFFILWVFTKQQNFQKQINIFKQGIGILYLNIQKASHT